MRWELIVVMPVYNEEAIISEVVASWISCLRLMRIKFRLALYNDGSKDKTAEVIDRLGLKYPELYIIHKKNSGHGPTIYQGYKEQFNEAEWVFQVDSDNEISPASFPLFWYQRYNFDFLIGIRNYGEKRPWSRALISWGAKWLILGPRFTVRDVNCPFRLIRTVAFKELFHSIKSDSFAPNVMMTAYAVYNSKIRTHQIPVPYSLRKTGEVSIRHGKLFKAAFLSAIQTILFLMRMRLLPLKMEIRNLIVRGN